MILGRQLVVSALGLVLLSGVGCANKKKAQLPTQATAPAEPIPTPLPSKISEDKAPPPAPPPQEETEAKAEEPKPQTTKRRKPHKPAQTPVVTQGSSASPPSPSTGPASTNTLAASHPPPNPANEPPPDTAIAADVTSAQLTQQKQTTAQLLDSTEKTLGGLRSLSHEQEEMVTQIRSYVAQSHKATTEGDFERAYNLATKAHLLTDALVKR
jgi:hypothetical protein